MPPVPKAFAVALFNDLRPVLFNREDVIVKKNDGADELRFIRKGEVDAISQVAAPCH